jgi:hypothetical protein
MRNIVFAVCILFVFCSASSAQVVDVQHSAIGAVQSAILQPPPVVGGSGYGHHCCNVKGALIGAIVGAASGMILTAVVPCDGGNCTAETAKAVFFLGAFGAGLGALAPSRQTGPALPGTHGHVNVAPAIGRQTTGALATVRF